MVVEPAPTVSVIIPVYNGGSYLRSSMGAVAASDYGSYECIVVDDGSTDGGRTIVAEFPMPVRIVDIANGPRGPAYARNRGAEEARGAILLFLDADIVLAPGVLRRVATFFQERTDVAAIFGSYDNRPAATGVVSQYRNLLHHFVHQNGHSNASTFWAGCGAIRRTVFEEVGGFDEQQFSRPSIEDIELGYRLRRAGYRILLDRQLQGTHLKRWSLCSMIRTDITCRALPWSRLIQQSQDIPQDLNIEQGQKVSVVLVGLACIFLIVAVAWPEAVALSALAIAGVVFLNRKLYAFFLRQRGILFATACVPLHLLYYFYSGVSYFYIWASLRLRRLATFRRRSVVKAATESFESGKS